jgi:hypothetical protein
MRSGGKQMIERLSPPERLRTPGRLGWLGSALAVILALVTANAIYGWLGLMADGFGMPDAWLDRMPLHSWEFGAWALLLTVAVPQAVAFILVIRRHALAGVVGFLAGAALVAWILVQLAILQRYFFLQPVIAGFGIVEMLLAWFWTRPARARTDS